MATTLNTEPYRYLVDRIMDTEEYKYLLRMMKGTIRECEPLLVAVAEEVLIRLSGSLRLLAQEGYPVTAVTGDIRPTTSGAISHVFAAHQHLIEDFEREIVTQWRHSLFESYAFEPPVMDQIFNDWINYRRFNGERVLEWRQRMTSDD